MAFYSGFFNSKGLDRTYTAEDFTSYLSSIICNGILDTYGQNFKLTAASSGLGVVLGTGKAWINGHYFINDSRYVIDLTSYQDESLPRYVGIAIYLDTTESVRSVSLRLFAGTPAENPSLPSIPQDEDHVRLLMYAVRMNPGASRITENDWFDYREDSNVCGYCKCILGKCKVTELMAQMAQLIVEVQENNETIAELTNKVEELEAEVEDIGDIIEAGKLGDDIFYALYSTGKVIVKGTGEMYEIELPQRPPLFGKDTVKNVVISEGVTTVGSHSFQSCMNLESVSLPTTLTKIGSISFMPDDTTPGASGKLTSITIPQSVTTIEGGAFWGAALTSLTVPPNVANVEKYVCRDCSRLTTVRYEGSVIGGFMFVGCTSLSSFTMASTVTSIGEHCFNYCSNLETITYEGGLDAWAAITKGTNWAGKGGQGIGVSGLTRINCLDGHLEWDSENNNWVEVRD
ncbi:MAG: leucine-rich repeat domain-containing protein [Oscillospiraceae bacterium]|nr:leucine-rich repeat domain-containing protein [Oscillospiraceae bacterium]